MTEYASQPLEIRAWADERTFTARVCNYNTPDSKGTTFAPGAFTRSLEAKLPKAVWSHDWHRPIGAVVGYDDTDTHLDVTVRMADFKRVPDSDMAHSLLKDGVIDEFSFGFQRNADQPDPNHKGITMITEADIKEVSPVLVGSVPGTRTLAVRAADGTLDVREEPLVDIRALVKEMLAEERGQQPPPDVNATETRDAVDAALALLDDGQTEQAAGLLQIIVDGLLEPEGQRSAEPDPETEARASEGLELLDAIESRGAWAGLPKA